MWLFLHYFFNGGGGYSGNSLNSCNSVVNLAKKRKESNIAFAHRKKDRTQLQIAKCGTLYYSENLN